ncbi:MAG: D-alanyl-D-alanine carboxypeptidase [Jaaginema sp. PMC 1079.18]|nr:D-alanyl-D-alanine carboxypeptidase [Jaaginema sp. PMC 1080.18]MEC4851120.1 D-alanyl-D-alanine carboxypeptidase [Jaaginema sp. PMC 1079.18]
MSNRPMQKLLSASLMGFLFWGQPEAAIQPLQELKWQETAFFQLPQEPNPTAEQIVKDYLKTLAAKGFDPQRQGVWLQSDLTRLAVRNGDSPLSAASLTKIATTVAALQQWELDFQFETQFYGTGEVKDGVLQGDLIVVGGDDPIFVWEEAIAIGNALNELGIRKITGNLLVSDNFFMNFTPNPALGGDRLKVGMNRNLWSREVKTSHALMPPGTPQPKVELLGRVMVQKNPPTNGRLLLRHQSLTLRQIIKQMNIYSNNVIAEVLAEALGGGEAVAKLAAVAAGVPPKEIQLINGSGLGVENRISPHATTAMLIALERQLEGDSTGVEDLFPVVGRDNLGTVRDRDLPPNTAMKTGTLARVSALAGILPTKEYGWVWFAIINEGGDIVELRAQQDRLLQNLSQAWGISSLPAAKGDNGKFGDPSRISGVENDAVAQRDD